MWLPRVVAARTFAGHILGETVAFSARDLEIR